MSSQGDGAAATTTGMNGTTVGPAPTPKEAAFFMSILNNMKNKPEVDWEVIAAKSGLSNGKVAATRFGQIKKKWATMSSDVDTTSSTNSTPKTPKTKTPKTKTPKTKTPKKGKGGSGTNGTPFKVTKSSPTPGPKKRGRKPKVKSEEEEEVQEEAVEAEMDDAAAEEDEVLVEEGEFYQAEEVEVYEED